MFKKPVVLSAVIVLAASASMADISDTCLIGTWVPAPGAFAEQFAASSGMGDVEISGEVHMVFTPVGGQYLLNGMVIKIQQPGMPPMAVAMNGEGAFVGEAEGGAFSFTMGAFNYAAEATIDMGGSPMVMDIPFTDEMAPMGGGAQGRYACSATTLSFDVEGREGKMVDSWVRQ
ncbi:MAG: hypothetical protein GQ535_00265 [Rhodobacteraceae bacterium]|nr:hypothetical protein [Paracoccaceae bacterium]